MGLPAEKFESVEMYMPRRAFLYAVADDVPPETQGQRQNQVEVEADEVNGRVIPVDFSTRYRELHRYVNKIGERFWLDVVNDTSDPSEHLALMAIATRHLKPKDLDIKDAEVDIQLLIKGSHTPPNDLVGIAHAHAIDRVPDYKGRKDKKGRYQRLGNFTYHDVHDMPEVRFAALNALRRDDFPAIEVVRSLEGWRWANDVDLSHDQHEVGRLAFETYLFSIGSIKFLPALGHAATAYLK